MSSLSCVSSLPSLLLVLRLSEVLFGLTRVPSEAKVTEGLIDHLEEYYHSELAC